MGPMQNLLKLREKINLIDENIIILLSKRKSLYKEIVKEKEIHKKPIKDENREKQLIIHLINLGKKYDISSKYITKIFNIIIEDSVLAQKKILQKHRKKNYTTFKKISYLGPKGSYSHLLIQQYFDNSSKKIIEYECNSFKEVLQKVEEEIAEYAILPLENTCTGHINEVLDLLQTTNLSIINEFLFPVVHCLLVNKNVKFNDIKTIYSHPQPFKQCSHFINKFPHWKIKCTHSTSSAMEKIYIQKLMHSAAIGNLKSGELYKLTALKKNISNIKHNITKFILLSKSDTINIKENLNYKVTLAILITKKLQSIADIILILNKQKITLIKIKSRPAINKNYSWEKVFFVDIKTNPKSESIKKTIDIIYNINSNTKILGCYPIAQNNNFYQN